MGTIDAQGIYKYASSDVVAPLETALNVGQQSVSDVFGSLGPGTIRYVANASARNALAASYTPTATKPLYVYQGDAPVGENIQFTFNGSVWHTIRDTRYVAPSTDVDWTNVTPASGYVANGAQVSILNGVVYFKGILSGPVATTALTIGSVSAPFRPVIGADGTISAVGLGTGGVGRAFINSAGEISLIADANRSAAVYLKGLSGYRIA